MSEYHLYCFCLTAGMGITICIILPFARAVQLFHAVQEDVGDDAGVGGCDVAGHLHHQRGGVDVIGDAQKQVSQPAHQEDAGHGHHALGCPHLGT